MMRIRFWQEAVGRAQAGDALEALAFRARAELDRGGVPPLYESGIVYRSMPTDRRAWKTPAGVMRDGHGDCADLAAWRIAELRKAGKRAGFRILRTRRNGLFHIVVALASGRVEDPSRKLGMGNASHGTTRHATRRRRTVDALRRQGALRTTSHARRARRR